MGGNQSALPPRPPGFEYMCVAIREPDKVRVILGTDHEVNIIRQAIQELYPTDIARETLKFNGAHQFNMLGSPFYTSDSSVAVRTRRMMERILYRLKENGWQLQLSMDLTQTKDLSSLMFKKVPATQVSLEPFLVVGLSSTDSLMVLNAPETLHQVFKDAVTNLWPSGIQKWSYKDEVLLIKLTGNPWCAEGAQAVHSRAMLQRIITDLFHRNWRLYGNANLKSTANTLFFQHDLNMTSGMSLTGLPLQDDFTLSLNGNDVVRLINAPQSLNSVVQDTLQRSWHRGIQQVSRYAGSVQFKLKGNPWWAEGHETVEARFLILKLLESLQSYGWSAVASLDTSRKVTDKSSFIFRRSQPRQAPFFCVSLNGTTKLRLINAPEDVIKICVEVLRVHYVLGVKRSFHFGKSIQFKLLGHPWRCGLNGHDGVHGRHMLCHLFHALAGCNWIPVISADVSAKYVQIEHQEIPTDVDSIFFTYDPVAAAAPPY